MALGETLPRIGLGTWPALGGEAVEMVRTAVDLGYPLIDTAQNYDNEAAVGEGIRRSGVRREELWVASKIRGKYQGSRTTIGAVEESLLRLRIDEIDLYMIHWPNPGRGLYVETWLELVDARARGLVRNIGVCNFTPSMLDELVEASGVAPLVNQIEMNPYWSRASERAAHVERGILTEAYSPLGRGGKLLAEPVLLEIARRRDVPVGTVVLAWAMARGATPLPKSATPERQTSNLASRSLILSEDELRGIDALDGANPDDPVTDPLGYEQL